MDIVKVSAKFQVVIPKKIREQLKLTPGASLRVDVVDGVIRLSPVRSLKDLRGMAKGMIWKGGYRDRTERF